MASTPTPHNAALEGQIAKSVIMPGDPLRAKFVADHYFDEGSVEQFNDVRNILGYTGTYHGKPVSVMASGMGCPSMGIYSYELFNFYGVENIIRIGTAGAMVPGIQLRDLLMAQGVCTDDNYASQYNMPGTLAPIADFGLLRASVEAAEKLGYAYKVGNVLSSEFFYNADPTVNERWASMGVMAAEMESNALYLNAMYAHKHALCLLTVSDTLYNGQSLTAEERQTSFTQMMEVALEVAVKDAL